MKIQRILLAYILCFVSYFSFAQIFPPATGTVKAILANAQKPSADVITFEVWIQNETSLPGLGFKAYGGGVVGIPAGTTGTLAVTEQPSANGFAIPNFTPNYNATAGPGSVPLMRWTSNPTGGTPTIPSAATKVAKFTFTRTGGTALPSTPSLAWTTGTANPPQIVVNDGVSSQTLTVANLLLSAALPVDLVDFKARTTGATNLIEWVTASERNTAWHVVERSANGTDNWEQIGKVAAAGTSSEQHTYSMEDKQPLAKTYYRLRSIDFDGQEERSNVVLVARKQGIFGVTGAYPSPTADRVTLQFESLEEMPVTVQVFDFNGRLVMKQDVLADKGVNLSELDMTNLQAGTYTLHLVTADAVSAQVKVVKQ